MRKYLLFLVPLLFIFACKNTGLYSLWRAHFENAFFTRNGIELRIAAKYDTLLYIDDNPMIGPYAAYIKGEFVFVQDTIVQYGHCWSTSNPYPYINPKDTTTYSRFYNWPYDSLGEFVSVVSLMPETKFYVRAYVITKNGDTGYLPVSYVDTTLAPVNEWFITSNLSTEGRENAAAFSLFDPNTGRECGFVVGGNNYFEYLGETWKFDPQTETWTNLAKLNPPRTDLVAFGIERTDKYGQKHYEIFAGTGRDDANVYNDFYKLDLQYNLWQAITDYPNYIYGAVSFVIDNTPYVGLGRSVNNIDVPDFYKLVVEDDTIYWRSVQPFANGDDNYRRHNAIAFVINDKAFVGCGVYTDYYGNENIYFNDLWLFYPPQGTFNGKWYKRADLPAAPREGAVGFAVFNQGFVGLGFDGNNLLKDFYRYDPYFDKWYKVADYKIGPQFTGQLQAVTNAAAFAIDNKAYVGTGFYGDNAEYPYSNEFWIYRP